MKDVAIKQILEMLEAKHYEYTYAGNNDIQIKGFSSIRNYKDDTVTWIKNNIIYSEVSIKTGGSVKLIVLPCGVEEKVSFENVIYTDKPKEVFFEILDYFYAPSNEVCISKFAIIDESARIGTNVSIGNYCTIGRNVVIGDNTIIENNVDIKDNVKIGTHCIIKSGAVIGGRGFGYGKADDGENIMITHYGGVYIGNKVHIGSNTCVDRGTIDDTRIMDGVKIDNLCHIAHNVVIGENTTVITQSKIFGSAIIGKNCNIVTSIVRNQIKIGDNVVVGMGSVVTKDVEDNKTVFGIPAKER